MSECLFAQVGDNSLIIETTPDGIYLYERRADGFLGDTWHSSVDEAKAQANYAMKKVVGAWQPVTKIHVKLPDEGTEVWAPVYAEHLRDDVYRIVDCQGAEAEFGKGVLVRCRQKTFSDGEALVAYETAEVA